jgi:hypothetical protein
VRSFLRFGFKLHKTTDITLAGTFTIQNDSIYDAKDFEVRCVHSGNSGTVIDSNTRTIYEVVKSRQKRTFRDFDMGLIHSQATRSVCELANFQVVGH